MSFNIRNIREIANDPSGKFANQLAKKLAKFLLKEQTEKLENKEDIYSDGQDIDVALRYQSLNSTKFFDYDTLYVSPSEPDYDKVKVWIRGDNIGNDINDISGFDNHGTLNGDPMLLDGSPFDYGIHTAGTKSICCRFNRPTSEFEDEEYISVEDSSSTQITGISTGIAFFIRFRLHSLAQQGSIDRTLFSKIDDDTPNNAYMARVKSDGKLQFFIKKGGTDVASKETSAGVIVADSVYSVFLTYTNSGDTVHIYTCLEPGNNSVDQTLSNISAPTWSTGTDHTMSIFRKHQGTGGYVYGDLWDFMLFKEKVPSFDSHGNSIQFDGSDDYVQCGNHADLWSQGLTKFSFSCWIYPTAGWDGNARFVTTHGGSSNHGFRCFIDSAVSNRIVFRITNSIGTSFSANNNTLQLNQWNFITCVYDNSLGSGNIKMYVNAVNGATTANLTETINLSANFLLADVGDDFKGNMRDFRFWKDTALNSTQITDVMNDSAAAPTSNYWLLMTEGSGTPTDIRGGKTATLTNGASWVTNEIGNHFINKLTLAFASFGKVMVSNYWSTIIPPPQEAYTIAGYTTTGYNT